MLFTKWNENTTEHYYPATLFKTVSFLVFVIFWLKQCTNVTHSYSNVAQDTHSYILTAHQAESILIDFWMLFELKTSIRQRTFKWFPNKSV